MTGCKRPGQVTSICICFGKRFRHPNTLHLRLFQIWKFGYRVGDDQRNAHKKGPGVSRTLGDDSLGGEDVLGDGGRVLQRRARDHRRVDDAGGDEIDDLVGCGVEPLTGLGVADVVDDDRPPTRRSRRADAGNSNTARRTIRPPACSCPSPKPPSETSAYVGRAMLVARYYDKAREWTRIRSTHEPKHLLHPRRDVGYCIMAPQIISLLSVIFCLSLKLAFIPPSVSAELALVNSSS